MSHFTQENKKGYKWLGQKQASKQNLQWRAFLSAKHFF